MSVKTCFSCGKEIIEADVIAINIKLFGEKTGGKFFCLTCLAENLEVTEDELVAKIQEYREEGCKLFT